jgi:hypothetical protein
MDIISCIGFKVINDKLVPKISYNKHKPELICECHSDMSIPYNDILYKSVIGGNEKIINYVIEHGDHDYNRGLQAATETNNLYFIKFFKNKPK